MPAARLARGPPPVTPQDVGTGGSGWSPPSQIYFCASTIRLLAVGPPLPDTAQTTTVSPLATEPIPLRTPLTPQPLHQAAALDRPEAVALLVSLRFPVNDRRGSPLQTAALLGHLNIAKLLVELGADPTAEIDARPGQFTPTDRTPLGWARYNHQHEVVAYLTRLPSAGPNPPASSAT